MSKIALSTLAVAILALPPCAALAQSPPAGAQVRSFALPPLEELQATRARPLFSPARRPDAEVVEAPEEHAVIEEAPETAPFELTGVVMGANRAIAILRNRDTMETVQVRQGETAEAWSVQEIAQRHVVLSNEGRQVRLQLFEPGAAGSSPPPNPNLDVPRPRRTPGMLAPAQRRASDRAQRRQRPPP